MTWPPNNQPTGGKSDSTPMATDHPSEHNAIKDTLDDIIAENAGALPLTGGTVTGDVQVDGQIKAQSKGQPSNPGIKFGDNGAGVYGHNDLVGFVHSGGWKLIVYPDKVRASIQLQAADGTKAAPGYSFGSDSDTGIHRPHSNVIEMVGNGKRMLQLGIDAGSVQTGAWMPTISTRTISTPANVWIHTDAAQEGALFRSTASRAFMQEVEAVNFEATNSVYDLEPIWFRSTCDGDDIEHSHYGLAAEDCAAVDPRLAIMATDENGVETADNVNTNAVIALLVSAVKTQRETIESLTARIEALET